MRLLNTTTLKIHEFTGKKVPKYAILSHRWEGQEASFQDARDGKNLDLSGWRKIKEFCAFARKWDWEYAWADTCCIDKSSSSELSESINSMYIYYRNAEECYAYLNDVSADLDQNGKLDALRRSKWFTRGWTLQELLAPTELYFLDSSWKIIGSKKTLDDVLSNITGIQDVSKINPSNVSVAARMSWASKRECSREEDNAYCLMGIFGINMPLLYGEGDNAFKRLQLEILKMSDDESLFAWWHSEKDFQLQTGLLANSPQDFRNSADISPYPFYPERAPYDMTNKGLQIEASLIPCEWLPGKVEMDSGGSRQAEAPKISRDDKSTAVTGEVKSRHERMSTLHMGRLDQYEHGDARRRLPCDQFRPFRPTRSISRSTSMAELLSANVGIWILPLNCRVRSNQHPVVLILANWGSKTGQCCRLFSEKSTDRSFGPEWEREWRGYEGIKKLTYIREADTEARQVLAHMFLTTIYGALPSPACTRLGRAESPLEDQLCNQPMAVVQLPRRFHVADKIAAKSAQYKDAVLK